VLFSDGRDDGLALTLQVVEHVVGRHKLRALGRHAAADQFVDALQQFVHHALRHFLGDDVALGQAH